MEQSNLYFQNYYIYCYDKSNNLINEYFNIPIKFIKPNCNIIYIKDLKNILINFNNDFINNNLSFKNVCLYILYYINIFKYYRIKIINKLNNNIYLDIIKLEEIKDELNINHNIIKFIYMDNIISINTTIIFNLQMNYRYYLNTIFYILYYPNYFYNNNYDNDNNINNKKRKLIL